MKTFSTFEELEKYLKATTDLSMTRRYLQDKVKGEEEFLVRDYKKKHSTIAWASKKKADMLATIKKTAREDYLEDINYYLVNSENLSYMSIMGYRRKPHAWAVANAIKQYEESQ